MFKQLSQFGKNISDEIARGLNEDSLYIDSQQPSGRLKREETGSNNYEEFPKNIQAKLNKFDKYEQKYPLLLSAYKAEKQRVENVETLLKILSENTPFSSLSDLDGIKGYFEDVNRRIRLLNDEIKRLTGENSSMSAKLKQMEDIVSEDEVKPNIVNECKMAVDKFENDNQAGLGKIEKYQDHLVNTKEAELNNFQEQLVKLQETLNEANSTNLVLEEKLKEKDDEIRSSLELIDSYRETIEKLVDNSEPAMQTKPASRQSKRNKNKFKGKNSLNKAEATVRQHNSVETVIRGNRPDISSKNEIHDYIKFKVKYENLLEDFNGVNAELNEYKSLGTYEDVRVTIDKVNSELSELRKISNLKSEELESVNDMLKVVGSELVETKDKLKERNQATEQIRKLEAELKCIVDEKNNMEKEYQLKLSQAENKLNDSKILKVKLQNEISIQKTRISELEIERRMLQEQLDQSDKVTSERAEKLKDFTAMKKSESVTKNALLQKEKTISYLEQQIKDYNKRSVAHQKEISELQLERDKLAKNSMTLTVKLEKLKEEIGKNDSAFENYIKENGKLSERLEVLQEKYDAVKNLKTNSKDHVDSIKRQCEELNAKLREANKKIIYLEDELNENGNILQDRIRETNAMRKLLNEHTANKDSKLYILEEKLANLGLEKEKLSSDFEIRFSSSIRELRELKEINMELKADLHNAVLKCTNLETELQEVKNLNTTIRRRSSIELENSEKLEDAIMNLRGALGNSEQRLRESKETNLDLKSLNESLVAKLDRSTKNYKVLLAQLQSVKKSNGEETPSRLDSITAKIPRDDIHISSCKPSISTVDADSVVNDKISYIKNVLLGFLEYRDQRSKLLPIVSMLLHLDSSDEKKLLMSLK